MNDRVERLEECVESWYQTLREITDKFNMDIYCLKDPGSIYPITHTDEEIEREKNG